MFNPAPTVVIEAKLDRADDPRPEADLRDFALRSELIRLMEQLDALGDGSVSRIDIRFGVPRRALIDRPMQGVRR